MAVDFSVLGGPTLPMKAKEFAPVDAVGNTEAAYTLAGTMVDTRRKMQAEQRINQDRQALEQAQRAGKLRMGSPEDIDAAIGFLQDKVSPETFLDMQSKGLKQKTDLQALQERVSKLPEREFFFGVLCTLRKQYMTDIISEASKKRFKVEDDNSKGEGIAITDAWFTELTKHPYHSSKYSSLNALERAGTGIFLMKEEAKLYKVQRERTVQ